jgi:hypothetical protein
MRSLPWLLLTTLVIAGQAVRQEVSHAPVKGTSFPKIQLNDNHRPTGHQHDHVLTLSLIADTGVWYPAGENERSPVTFRIPELRTMTAPTNPLTTWAEWSWVSRYVLKLEARALPRSPPKGT